MSRPAQAVIDIAALCSNVQQVRRWAPQQKIIAVIKADAYGHGAVRVAQAIENLVEAFAVSCLEEALKLRAMGIQLPIVLLEGFFQAEELPLIAQHHLHSVIHTHTQVEQLLKISPPLPIPLWLKIDTGMHRLGFAPTEVEEIFHRLKRHLPTQTPLRLLSHLASADDPQSQQTLLQTQGLLNLVNTLQVESSLANSAGILGWPLTHRQWVRPGIMLYGVSPLANNLGATAGLQPVMELQSALISVKRYRRGETIGYSATWECPEEMPVGVVAIGYADGYPRHAPAGTPVLVNGKRVPLIGRVSMDMVTVDLRTQPEAKVGDVVVLWGKQLPIEEIASSAGTIPYELLCHICPRVRRIEKIET